MSRTRPLFAALVDDAAMFPPGNAGAQEAVEGHLRYRASGMSSYVGRLLVHTDRLDDVVTAHARVGGPPIDLVVLGRTALPAGLPRTLVVTGLEVAVDGPELPAPAPVPMAYEIGATAAGFAALQQIATARREGRVVVAKFRTGGVTAAAFPPVAAVADVIIAAAAAGVPLKFTAGLHHGTRFTDAATGFLHHGFLNLAVAVQLALRARPRGTVIETLEVRDPEKLAHTVSSWSDQDDLEVRSMFTSFGCCGVEEPVRDLVELGLVDPAGRLDVAGFVGPSRPLGEGGRP